MESDQLSQFELTGTDEIVKIYSKKAIWGFSIFFSTIFGGVLLMQNLLALDKKKKAYQVLAFSILYTALSIYLLNLLTKSNMSITYCLNALGGLILTKYFFVNYIPNENMLPKKKIWKALIISLLILIPFVAATIFVALNNDL